MTTVPLSEAKDTLSALVEAAQSTHDIVTITRHGRPAAVLMSVDDLESLQETVFWLSRPGVREDIAAADAALPDGSAITGAQLLAELGLPG